MTSTSEVSAVSAAPARPVVQRRTPRHPMRATILLVVWVLVLISGVIAVLIAMEGGYGIRARVEPIGLIAIGVLLVNWLLLVWRARVLKAMDVRAKNAQGAVCLNCHTVLSGEVQEGHCPKCGDAFTMSHLRMVWKQHTP